ncbi:sulfatase-like hydrolase/transferase [Vibrio mediterranei]|uniref:sulfatase-like hydrolase/transferase n=1 Tax=Vibrio mediterranei TaxID=689 RepID=UPI001EFD2276|nr:sulfatase-like hydrolase/transferase [Vibrio mediterranei]MCG9624426.1 sulfatase-like hydrolase/transferase [Vibrio mediterranei]MCG9663219.1 sulfatase-like hydrolase/transferase [Vibrio mediterranei]
MISDFLNPKERKGMFYRNEQKKPNIIFITVDMISADCYHPDRPLSKVINTPNINAIADGGTAFSSAFTPSPLCGPARAAIFTGMHPPYLSNGERTPVGMKVDLELDDIIFQDYLKRIGYSLKHSGKCHVGVEKFVRTFGENVHAWDRWGPPVEDDDRYLTYLAAQGVQLPQYRKELRGLQIDKMSPANSFGGWIEQQDGSDFPLDAHYSVFLAKLAIDQIKASRIQAPNKPIFSQLEFFDPHQPYSVPSGLEQRYQEIKEAITLPDSFDLVEPDNPIYALYQQYWGMYDEDMVSDYIACHLLQVEVVDHAIGHLIQFLKQEGLWDDTAIVFSADHGDMNGRMAMADKGSYFQPDIFRIPLMIKPPKSERVVETVSKVAVSAIDIAPTILGFAGIEIPPQMEGDNLSKVMQGEERRPLTQVYQTGVHVGCNYGFGFQVDIEDKKYFYGYNATTGFEELHHLDRDDQTNLLDSSDYLIHKESIVAQAKDLLLSDPRWMGYWSSYRLHNARYLPVSSEDMQMLKPV